MAGASRDEWNGLISFALGDSNCVYLYDHVSKDIAPSSDVIPWYVCWFLSSHSPKHILAPRKPPDLADLNCDLLNFENRMKWAWIHRDSPRSELPFIMKKASVPPCRLVVDPDLDRWLKAMRQRTLRKCASLLRHCSRSTFSNMVPLHYHALSAIKKLPYIFLPNDKERGYCAIHFDAFRSLESMVLDPLAYRPLRIADADFKGIANCLGSIARRIESATGITGIAKQILTPMMTGCAIASLSLQVKTHKARHQMGVRNLHKAPNFAFAGLSKWVVSEICAHVPLPHCFQDSLQLKSLWQDIVVPVSARLSTTDIKDFYMSGEPDEIVNDILGVYGGPHSNLLREAMTLLFDWQFVRPLSPCSFIYKVIRGSGMGLPHSGTIASACFYARVERQLLCAASMAKFGILKYGRYHDDIIMVHTDKPKFQSFFADLRAKARDFKVLCTDVGPSVRYLDVVVSIKPCGKLDVVPYMSKKIVPLHASSAHVGHVHRSWPASVTDRIISLSSPQWSANDVQERLVTKYASSGASDITLRVIKKRCLHHNLNTQSQCTRNLKSPDVVWLKAGAHPIWTATLQRIVSSTVVPPCLRVTPRVCWRNALPNISMGIQSSNNMKLECKGRTSSIDKLCAI
jgi:hypothetical protein